MPKFVWEITGRGQWRPQLFHGELPREMTMPHNAGRYAMHELSDGAIRIFGRQAKADPGSSILDKIAAVYPAPVQWKGITAMSFKSIFRAVGEFFGALGSPAPGEGSRALDRLTARRDWQTTPGNDAPYKPARLIVTDGEGVDPNRPPHVDPWPACDDPYAKPEPCDIVQDPALLRVQKLTERGLIVPFATKSDLSNVMDLIDRQEAAEKHLRKIGMIWERDRGWYLP